LNSHKVPLRNSVISTLCASLIFINYLQGSTLRANIDTAKGFDLSSRFKILVNSDPGGDSSIITASRVVPVLFNHLYYKDSVDDGIFNVLAADNNFADAFEVSLWNTKLGPVLFFPSGLNGVHDPVPILLFPERILNNSCFKVLTL